MRWPHFRRARRCGRTARDRLAVYALGLCAGLLAPLLIWDVGLFVHLVTGDQAATVPHDWILWPWISGNVVAWPWWGNEQWCLLTLLGFGVLIGLVEVSALWLLNIAVERSAWSVAARLRQALHEQAFRLGATELLGARREPERLFVEQVERIRVGLVRWWNGVPFAVTALLALVAMALAVNLWLGLVVILAVLLIRQLYQGWTRFCDERAAAWDQEAAAAFAPLVDGLRLSPLLSAYGADDAPGRSVAEMLAAHRRAWLRSVVYRAGRAPILLLLVLLAVAYVMLVVGLSRYVSSAGTVVLTLAVVGAYFPAARLLRLRSGLAEADTAAEQVFAYLEREPSIREIERAAPLAPVREAIELRGVTLADGAGLKLLDRIDVRIPAGRRVAIVAAQQRAGPALAGLLVRLYDPAAGQILFDGVDLATARLATVRDQALLVTANGMVFSGTVNDNITCGDPRFTTLQITDAAKQARAHHFVLDLPRGFATTIGPHGIELTASQAFRIGLARALLREPSVLVVEEPAVEQDPATVALLEEALRWAAANRTLIMLPARLHTLRHTDAVLLIHEGKLEAEGPHAELLQSSELYRHLNYVRFHAFHNIR